MVMQSAARRAPVTAKGTAGPVRMEAKSDRKEGFQASCTGEE
jgi:hypothetical protein